MRHQTNFRGQIDMRHYGFRNGPIRQVSGQGPKRSPVDSTGNAVLWTEWLRWWPSLAEPNGRGASLGLAIADLGVPQPVRRELFTNADLLFIGADPRQSGT